MEDGYFIELFNEVSVHITPEHDVRDCFGYTHFAFLVDNMQEFYNSLIEKDAGDCIEIEPGPALDGNYVMWIHDPDGNRMEVQQYTKDSLQIQKAL